MLAMFIIGLLIMAAIFGMGVLFGMILDLYFDLAEENESFWDFLKEMFRKNNTHDHERKGV